MSKADTDTLAALEPLKNHDQISTFDLRTLAEAIGMSPRSVKHLADNQKLKTVKISHGGKRYVQLEELIRLAENGWQIDVERLVEGADGQIR